MISSREWARNNPKKVDLNKPKEAFNGDYLYLPEDISSQELIKEIFGKGEGFRFSEYKKFLEEQGIWSQIELKRSSIKDEINSIGILQLKDVEENLQKTLRECNYIFQCPKAIFIKEFKNKIEFLIDETFDDVEHPEVIFNLLKCLK